MKYDPSGKTPAGAVMCTDRLSIWSVWSKAARLAVVSFSAVFSAFVSASDSVSITSVYSSEVTYSSEVSVSLKV